jgi:hypothetical protein
MWNWFNKVKLPKVGSNAIVPVPVGAGPNKTPMSPFDPQSKKKLTWPEIANLEVHYRSLRSPKL